MCTSQDISEWSCHFFHFKVNWSKNVKHHRLALISSLCSFSFNFTTSFLQVPLSWREGIWATWQFTNLNCLLEIHVHMSLMVKSAFWNGKKTKHCPLLMWRGNLTLPCSNRTLGKNVVALLPDVSRSTRRGWEAILAENEE